MAWAEFSQGADNAPLLVNVALVEVAVRSGEGTALYFRSDSQEFYRVNQSLAKVKEIISEAEGF